MPFGIQPIHIIIVAIAALVIFGPSRLPELGRSLGKSITEFRKGMKEMTEGMREELQDPNKPQSPTPPASGSQYFTPSQPYIGQPAQPPQAPVQPVQVAPNAVLTCPSCGSANVPEARFCNHCGASLTN